MFLQNFCSVASSISPPAARFCNAWHISLSFDGAWSSPATPSFLAFMASLHFQPLFVVTKPILKVFCMNKTKNIVPLLLFFFNCIFLNLSSKLMGKLLMCSTEVPLLLRGPLKKYRYMVISILVMKVRYLIHHPISFVKDRYTGAVLSAPSQKAIHGLCFLRHLTNSAVHAVGSRPADLFKALY